MLKKIKKIILSSKVNMEGIILDQPLPDPNLEMVDPFLLIHHWKKNLPGGQKENESGVGPHPHRGFSPVTFIFKGGVHHRDSLGNSSIVKRGGVQWMFAGNGIVHSERPVKELVENGGEFEIIQLWINVPVKHKMDRPEYTALDIEDIPVDVTQDGLVRTFVISGEFKGQKGPVLHKSPVLVLRIDLKNNGKVSFEIPTDQNSLIYILNGELKINNIKNAGSKSLVLFENNSEKIHLEAERDTKLILIAGKPIGEKVVSYGPFVMNTNGEILAALRDSQSGKMGRLTEVFK